MMARRKRTSAFEDIVDVIAMFPWWMGLILALVIYVWLHYIATQPIPVASTDMKNIGTNVGRQLWQVLATFGQYILPVACLLGAGISAYGRFQRNQLHQQVAVFPSRHSLESMSWRQFEKLVSEVFRRKGFVVEERGGNGPDGGVDLSLRLGNDLYLVQCKQWKAMRVGVAIVRELYGVMAAEHAVGGFVVASGDFTDDARQFAQGRSIELVGTDQLLDLIEETAGDAVGGIRADKTGIPVCPTCGASMIRRTAKRGANAGGQFWGCSNYPNCRGIR
jgi:restriction system protein